jgi:hypothetical protein
MTDLQQAQVTVNDLLRKQLDNARNRKMAGVLFAINAVLWFLWPEGISGHLVGIAAVAVAAVWVWFSEWISAPRLFSFR